MSIPFVCPYCKTETVVDDAYAGHSGPCYKCGRIVHVPGLAGERQPIIARVERAGLSTRSLPMLIAVILGSLLAGATIIGFGVSVIAPAVAAARVESRRASSAVHLQQIAQAMMAYKNQYGVFPPAYVADAAGKPMHSWRVLLLPFLNEGGLHRQYDYSQPWDSPQNMLLASRIPEVYVGPGDPSAAAGYETSYLVIVGQGSVFPGSVSVPESEITDGPGATILVVESYNSGICWMEPKDLEMSSMNFSINGAPTDCIRSQHPNGANVLLADGQVRFLTIDTPPEYVEAFATRNKGDNVFLDALPGP
jgi:prepilin-type processing-associated H-X9-DG protein